MAVYTHCCRAQPLRQLGFLGYYTVIVHDVGNRNMGKSLGNVRIFHKNINTIEVSELLQFGDRFNSKLSAQKQLMLMSIYILMIASSN